MATATVAILEEGYKTSRHHDLEKEDSSAPGLTRRPDRLMTMIDELTEEGSEEAAATEPEGGAAASAEGSREGP